MPHILVAIKDMSDSAEATIAIAFHSANLRWLDAVHAGIQWSVKLGFCRLGAVRESEGSKSSGESSGGKV